MFKKVILLLIFSLLLLAWPSNSMSLELSRSPTFSARTIGGHDRPDTWVPLAACPVSEQAANVPLYLISGQGDYVPSVTVGSQDNVMKAGRIEIEEGDGPISLAFLLPDDRGMIWVIEGPKERVQRVYVMERRVAGKWNDIPKSGVVGIPADRIVFTSGGGCPFGFTDPNSANGLVAGGAVRTILGQTPQLVIGLERFDGVAIPSGGSAGPAPADMVETFHCGSWSTQWDACDPARSGLLHLDPVDVAGSGPVYIYETLPGGLGLHILSEEGKIELERLPQGDIIHVNEAIRTPPGGCQFSNFKFSLRPGVPMVTGALCRSCVYSADTNTVVFNENEISGQVCKSLIRK